MSGSAKVAGLGQATADSWEQKQRPRCRAELLWWCQCCSTAGVPVLAPDCISAKLYLVEADTKQHAPYSRGCL